MKRLQTMKKAKKALMIILAAAMLIPMFMLVASAETNRAYAGVLENGQITVTSIPTGDVNGDYEVNSDDAIYLLYYTLLPELYPLN